MMDQLDAVAPQMEAAKLAQQRVEEANEERQKAIDRAEAAEAKFELLEEMYRPIQQENEERKRAGKPPLPDVSGVATKRHVGHTFLKEDPTTNNDHGEGEDTLGRLQRATAAGIRRPRRPVRPASPGCPPCLPAS